MEDEKLIKRDPMAELKKEMRDTQPILISRGQLREVIAPLIAEVKQTVIDVMPIIPKRIDTEMLTKDIAAAVKEAVVVKHETVENTVIQEVTVPPEIVKLLELQSHAITLLKSMPKPVSMDDYKPHDQQTVKADKSAFYGFAAPSGAWYILYSKGSLQRYAAGNEGYREAWKARGDHTYTTLSEAMNG